MPTYRLPTFNLTCNIAPPSVPFHHELPAGPTRVSDKECQLTYGHRVNLASSGGTPSQGTPVGVMSLLLPAGTDIRGPQDNVSSDLVEVPSGSGRWYWVAGVDDIGKGFANEHRFAYIVAIQGVWTAPYP